MRRQSIQKHQIGIELRKREVNRRHPPLSGVIEYTSGFCLLALWSVDEIAANANILEKVILCMVLKVLMFHVRNELASA